MNYEEACQYINQIPKFTTKNSLDHTRELLDLLGNPQGNYQVIHVAGTNGKGSVCAFVNEILQAEGYRVGMFTSPHLISMTERMMINSEAISQEDFSAVFDEVMLAVRVLQMRQAPHPSFFEFLFAMGMLIFERAKVQYVILETGLGGRLDATNSIRHPLLSVITSISLDHMMYLGDTVEAIAKEKAGIIKDKGIVIYDGNEPAAQQVIAETACNRQAEAVCVTKDAYDIQEITPDSIAFLLTDGYDEDTLWRIGTGALYQVDNAVIAITACRQIIVHPRYALWKNAVSATRWPGRMEKMAPGLYIDGAHNIGAVKRFTEQVKQADVILFSAVRDKDYEEMIQWMCSHMEVKTYVITSIDDERGEAASRLGEVFSAYTKAEVLVRENLKSAWDEALSHKPEGGMMYGLGSLYLIGMIKELIQEAN